MPDTTGDTFVVREFQVDYTFGINYAYDATGDGGNNDIAVIYLSSAATPEPTSAALLGLSGFLLLRLRKKPPACLPLN